MKVYILLVVILLESVVASGSPREESIYFHLHQAGRWAELFASRECAFSTSEMKMHLGKIKYGEPMLIKSIFHEEYIFLRNIAFNNQRYDVGALEVFRATIHSKAEKNNVVHPKGWRAEFILCEASSGVF